jgi:O-antigen/teichoic acid export membrane protein
MFSVEEFGMIDVVDVLVFFLLLLTSFEIPTALGRYYYESKESNYKKTIISTGFFLTLFFTIFFTLLALFSERSILTNYIGSTQYRYIFRLALVWLFLTSVGTYLSFIPRYDNKAKQYVIVSLISISTKLLSSILFVVVFNMGLEGVFWGYISGTAISCIIYYIIVRKVIGFEFSLPLAKKMIYYSAPLMFGVLAIGAWAPLSRYLILSFFPVLVIGYYSFSSRIVSVNSIIHSALAIAWKPLLFENKNILTQADHIKRISGLMSLLSLFIGISLTTFAPEITLLIGKSDFLDGVALIGLLALATTIKALTELRGFAPYLTDKTYIVSITNMLAIVICALIMILLKDRLGLIGIGLVMILYESVNYIILSFYTYKKYSISLHNKYEIGLLLLLVIAELTIIYSQRLVVRGVLFIILVPYIVYIFKKLGMVQKMKQFIKHG